MPTLIATCQYTITDLLDPIASGIQPSNPTEGMIWLNTGVDPVAMYIYNGGSWELLNDGYDRSKIFTLTPTVPYNIGDLWVQGSNGDILVCTTPRNSSESYNSNDWVSASKYTGDASLQEFISNTYNTDITNINQSLDNKIETWFQDNDPSTAWTTTTLKLEHIGDMWYSSSTNLLKRYSSSYTWTTIQDQKAIDAYDNASHAQDTADNKRRVFVGSTTPVPPYDIGDLWTQGSNGDILVCNNPKASGATYALSDWIAASEYKPYQIYTGTTAPVDTNMMWLDTTDSTKPILKSCISGEWKVVGETAKVFTSTPTVPYSVGDLWIYTNNGISEMRVCTIAKSTGQSYSLSDWTLSSNYTTDQIYTGNEAPQDTSLFWMDTSNPGKQVLKRYSGSEWVIIGDVIDVSTITQDIIDLQTSLETVINNYNTISESGILGFSITDYEKTIQTINGTVSDLVEYKAIQDSTFEFSSGGFKVGTTGTLASVNISAGGVNITDEEGAIGLSLTAANGLSARKVRVTNLLIIGGYKIEVADNGSISFVWIGI